MVHTIQRGMRDKGTNMDRLEGMVDRVVDAGYNR
jgi:hypothetical protein